MLKGLFAGAAALGLALVATAGEAAPVRLGGAVERAVAGPIVSVQFFDWDDEYEDDIPPAWRPAPPVYRAPPVYYAPRPVYRVPRDPYGYRPIYRPAPGYGYWDKEAAKDYVKSYRRTQKELFKERVRAWNRANGY